MPGPIWLLVHPRGLVVRRGEVGTTLPTRDDVVALGLDPAAGHEVGRLAGGEQATAAAIDGAALAPPFEVLGLREVFPLLGEDVFVAAGAATQLVEWEATNRHCGRCATPTARSTEDRSMRCPACGLSAYPRIAPAVIVLVRRGDEALLARGARFPRPFYSTLAGFVEVGETLEQAVAREIREEVGVEVKDVRYFGSQPWPFPHSLMVAFTAAWAGGDIRPDPAEILDARWFEAGSLPLIPPPISIARRLIDAWLAEVGRSPKGAAANTEVGGAR
jgi:NAD+ diphosphatase